MEFLALLIYHVLTGQGIIRYWTKKIYFLKHQRVDFLLLPAASILIPQLRPRLLMPVSWETIHHSVGKVIVSLTKSFFFGGGAVISRSFFLARKAQKWQYHWHREERAWTWSQEMCFFLSLFETPGSSSSYWSNRVEARGEWCEQASEEPYSFYSQESPKISLLLVCTPHPHPTLSLWQKAWKLD